MKCSDTDKLAGFVEGHDAPPLNLGDASGGAKMRSWSAVSSAVSASKTSSRWVGDFAHAFVRTLEDLLQVIDGFRQLVGSHGVHSIIFEFDHRSVRKSEPCGDVIEGELAVEEPVPDDLVTWPDIEVCGSVRLIRP
jgi:hypothetical protein